MGTVVFTFAKIQINRGWNLKQKKDFFPLSISRHILVCLTLQAGEYNIPFMIKTLLGTSSEVLQLSPITSYTLLNHQNDQLTARLSPAQIHLVFRLNDLKFGMYKNILNRFLLKHTS